MLKDTIRAEMKRQGLSATTLATKAGMRIASVTEYFADRKELNSANIEKILNTLNVNIMSSDEMVSNFKNGGLIPIYEKMVSEIIESKELKENRLISKCMIASYIMGRLAAKIFTHVYPHSKGNGCTYTILEKIIYQENNQSPYQFMETLIINFIKYAECFDDHEKELYAILSAELSNLPKDADGVACMAAFFSHVK